MEDRIRFDHPLTDLHGYAIRDSSHVSWVGWQDGAMVVTFKDGSMYRYDGVSRQRAVACALSNSVGQYLHRRIKPHFGYQRLA